MTEEENTFYSVWENIVDRLSDKELEATIAMIDKYRDALNRLIREEYAYRNQDLNQND
jgi:hypothetical protein